MITYSYLTGDSDKREECGIIAIISKKGTDVAPAVYRSLVALQHRGQDAAGMVVYDGKTLQPQKGLGLVADIYADGLKVSGHIGIGHTRYPTTGRCQIEDVQPSIFGKLAVTHNGHLANYDEVRKMLGSKGFMFTGTVDSEVIALLLSEKMEDGIEAAVRHAMETLDGAYSDGAIEDGKLHIFRDPYAIRPLVWGENDEYVAFASESVALDINNIPYKGEVGPGELVTVEKDGTLKRREILKKGKRHCMFEYVYFSRPDSIINGKYVYEVRKGLGRELAKEHPVKADVIVPVPDTSRTAAEEFAKETGIPFEEALIKNRYIGRTFIMPTQEKRANAVKMKLNAVRGLLEGKRVVLIDDSIVRGTTLREIVALVKNAGAKEVHLRITSPPIKMPCFYGVDMPTYKELIANNKSIEETREFMGADSLGHLSIDGLKKAIGLPICSGCLDGGYPTEYAKKMAEMKKGDVCGCG
ncbi:MAG: amidophosphoribosyltransferase [Candidatus Micrarchaeia archaeon]